MTDQEKKVLELTKDVWNDFLKLPEQHKDDEHDFRFHIHALQNIVLAREGVRAMDKKG